MIRMNRGHVPAVPSDEELREQFEEFDRSAKAYTASLPLYNRHANCPKCLFLSITTTYEPVASTGFGPFAPFLIHGERMVRTCPNCRYSWNERPL